MNIREGKTGRIGFWVVLLIGLFSWAPATYPGYWQALEGFVPVFNVTRPSALATIAITPDLWRGAGLGSYLIAQPLLALSASPVTAIRITYIAALLFGGLGTYVWLFPRMGDRVAGLAGLLYMLYPPLLATVYIRGNLSDAVIVGLLPLILAGVETYALNRTPMAAGVVVLGILWMWRTQAGLAAIASGLLLTYTLFVTRDWLVILSVVLSSAAGVTSLVPFWSVNGQPPVQFLNHLVHFYQLFVSDWTVAPSLAGWQDQYPFQLGFAIPVFTIVALWLWIHQSNKPKQEVQNLLWFSLVVSLLLILLSLNYSWIFWRGNPASRLLSYPWQLLLLAAPFLVTLAGSLPKLHDSLSTTRLWIVLIGVTLLSSYPFLTTRFTQYDPPKTPVAVIGSNNDLILLAATLTEDKNRTEARLDITWQALHPLEFDYNVFFQALTTTDGALQVVAQLDTQPKDGIRSATTWEVGEILTDTYRLDLSALNLASESTVSEADAPKSDRSATGKSKSSQGRLQYFFGYYDWRDGVRLPVHKPFSSQDDKLLFYGR